MPEQRPIEQKKENAFKPDIQDFWFALIVFALGYLFSRWVFFSWLGWGVTAFTTAYLLFTSAYMIKKGVYVKSAESWFWLAITWVTGLSYALWENAGFSGIRALFLFCSAVYYIIVASDRSLMGKTGNFLILDGINAVVIIPFRNLINQYVSFSVLVKGEKRGKTLPVVLGILLAVIMAAILIPLLERADSGGFGIILGFFSNVFDQLIAEIVFYAMLSIPVAAYIYGLASGAVHKKGTDLIKLESARKASAAVRVLQPTTIYIVLGSVCVLYIAFILSQAPYFFSAFTGRRPEGWLIYSEYARRGFFELCWIAAINLIVLTVSNVTSKKRRMELQKMKLFNIAIAVITLILIATAFSKMALYIGAYGLTMRRLLPCVLMVFLALVFVALVVLQKKEFPIVRFALIVGSIMFCILSMSNPDAMVVRYNANAYLNGSLAHFDTEILYRAGSAGVIPAIKVHESTYDEALKNRIAWYLSIYVPVDGVRGSHLSSYESQRAGNAVIPVDFRPTTLTPPRYGGVDFRPY